jgi:hypothetical protein
MEISEGGAVKVIRGAADAPNPRRMRDKIIGLAGRLERLKQALFHRLIQLPFVNEPGQLSQGFGEMLEGLNSADIGHGFPARCFSISTKRSNR